MADNWSHLSYVSTVVVGDNSLEFAREEEEIDVSQIHPSVCKNVEGLITEMIEWFGMREKINLLFTVERGEYGRVTNICNADWKSKTPVSFAPEIEKKNWDVMT